MRYATKNGSRETCSNAGTATGSAAATAGSRAISASSAGSTCGRRGKPKDPLAADDRHLEVVAVVDLDDLRRGAPERRPNQVGAVAHRLRVAGTI
jgi:hypothetical protein